MNDEKEPKSLLVQNTLYQLCHAVFTDTEQAFLPPSGGGQSIHKLKLSVAALLQCPSSARPMHAGSVHRIILLPTHDQAVTMAQPRLGLHRQ